MISGIDRLLCSGSFCGRSLLSSSLSSGSSLSLSLCCSLSGLFLSHLLGYLLVHLLLLSKFLGGSVLLCLSLSLGNLLQTVLLVSLPCVELLLGCGLVESALLDTTTQVLQKFKSTVAGLVLGL